MLAVAGARACSHKNRLQLLLFRWPKGLTFFTDACRKLRSGVQQMVNANPHFGSGATAFIEP